jgi:hypothetical protein
MEYSKINIIIYECYPFILGIIGVALLLSTGIISNKLISIAINSIGLILLMRASFVLGMRTLNRRVSK